MNRNNESSPIGRHGDEKSPGFGAELFGHIKVGVIATLVLAVVVSGLYPAVVWALAQVLFNSRANGSLIGKDGKPADAASAVGSSLIGQSFSDAKYFHGRPSAAGSGYDATASGGSNLGPTSAKLMFGTTKNFAFTVFAGEKSHPPVVPVVGRVQGTVAEVTKTTITVAVPGGTKTLYALDPTVADPNTTVNFHGRTIHATTIAPGAIVELKLNDKTSPAVTAINVADQELDGTPASIDTTANKITLSDASSTVVNVDPKNTAFIVNGKAGALTDITTDMAVHIVSSTQMDYDGIADRVIQYCEANNIGYESSIPGSAFKDADGVDDEKLVAAFNAATMPTITPKTAVPADSVTASGSGLDPHISPANARLQAQRVADARKMKIEKVNDMIDQYTDGSSLGFLGDSGVNVLRLNLALDEVAPVAAPAAAPTTAPTTAP